MKKLTNFIKYEFLDNLKHYIRTLVSALARNYSFASIDIITIS